MTTHCTPPEALLFISGMSGELQTPTQCLRGLYSPLVMSAKAPPAAWPHAHVKLGLELLPLYLERVMPSMADDDAAT